MKILVIGSKGFIGSHCVSYFKLQGHDVLHADVVQHSESGYTCLDPRNTAFDGLFNNQNFDICINASGSAHVGFSFENPTVDFELNVLNVHKILVAIRGLNPSCRLINFSSAAVYGNPEKLPIREDQTRNPLSPYGFHKLQSEYILKEYHRFFGIGTASLRIFSAYGPGLKKQLFWDLYQKAKAGNTVELFGSGNESRDFIYIADLLTAIDAVVRHASFNGDCYNIASGTETTIRDVVETFYSHLNPDIQVRFSGIHKPGDPDNWRADISALKTLGFTPKWELKDGLFETAAWLRHEMP